MVRGGKKKKDRNKPAKVTVSVKDLKRQKEQIALEMTERINLLYLTVLAEEYGFDEDKLCEVMETVTRWAGYIDEKIVPIEKTAEIIERKTGMKLTKWSK